MSLCLLYIFLFLCVCLCHWLHIFLLSLYISPLAPTPRLLQFLNKLSIFELVLIVLINNTSMPSFPSVRDCLACRCFVYLIILDRYISIVLYTYIYRTIFYIYIIRMSIRQSGTATVLRGIIYIQIQIHMLGRGCPLSIESVCAPQFRVVLKQCFPILFINLSTTHSGSQRRSSSSTSSYFPIHNVLLVVSAAAAHDLYRYAGYICCRIYYIYLHIVCVLWRRIWIRRQAARRK